MPYLFHSPLILFPREKKGKGRKKGEGRRKGAIKRGLQEPVLLSN